MLGQKFSKDLNIPPETNRLLVLAKSSLSTITWKVSESELSKSMSMMESGPLE